MCPLCYFDLSKCKIPEALEELLLEGNGSTDTSGDAENGITDSSDAENSSEDDEYFP